MPMKIVDITKTKLHTKLDTPQKTVPSDFLE